MPKATAKSTTTKATSSAPTDVHALNQADADVLTTLRDRLGGMEEKVLEIRDLARVIDLMSGSGDLSAGCSAAFGRVSTVLIDKAELLDEERGELWRMSASLLK
jgi:hypothetical protein